VFARWELAAIEVTKENVGLSQMQPSKALLARRRTVTILSALSLYTMNLSTEVQTPNFNCKQLCLLERKMVGRCVPSSPFDKP
jgi:hypothetical protein